MRKLTKINQQLEEIKKMDQLSNWAAPADPETKKAKFISWRDAPGYRDIYILVEIDGRKMWLHFDKNDTQTLRNTLNDVIHIAGKNPIDK